MQIAIARSDLRVDLWCEVSLNKDGVIEFDVINGGWRGHFEDDVVTIQADGTIHPCFIVWAGEAPFSDRHYNEAIEWIETQIADPTYRVPAIENIVERTRIYYDDIEDDITF